MSLAQRFDRLISNRVLAEEVPCERLGAHRFRKGDYLMIAGADRGHWGRIWRVWGHRNDADTLLVY